MRIPRSIVAACSLSLAAMMGVASTFASPLPTLSAPATYGFAFPDCPSGPTSDTITISGIAPGQELKGWVAVEYVVPASDDVPTGRLPVPGNPYPILVNVSGSTTSSFSLTVNYPDSSEWPTFPVTDPNTGVETGTKEIHVGMAIEVYEDGILVGTLGPGQDFDVYCIGNPPPPPPPPPPSFSPRTIGFWKTHTTSWPISTIPFGCAGTGDDLSDEAAIAILKKANAKDMTYQLAAQLIGSKLNVASGASTSIQSTINAADAFLCEHAVGSDPQGVDRTHAEMLKNSLDTYNNSGES